MHLAGRNAAWATVGGNPKSGSDAFNPKAGQGVASLFASFCRLWVLEKENKMKINVTDMEIRNIDYRELQPLQGDLKDLSKKNYAKLKKSFESKGMFVPIFVWDHEGKYKILDGHGRERLFSTEKPVFTRGDGSETHEVPCLIIQAGNLKDAKEKLLIISSQYQEMTVEGFQEFTFDLDVDFMKDTMPFDDLLKGLDGADSTTTGEDDPEIDVPDEPVTKRGDLWQLGEHLLLCADASDPEAVAALMGDEKANLVFTDPPYNAGGNLKSGKYLYQGTSSEAMQELAEVEWDKDFQVEPVLKTLETAIGEDCSVYICTSHFLAGKIWEWMAENFTMSGYNVWVKPNPMPSLKKRHWTWATELICYASRGKHTFNFPAQGHALSFWEFRNRDGKRIHPTQKPISVPEHAIKHSSIPGSVVLDLFGGSGTTLISCEVQGRKCRMMEISEAYCDAIIFRWEAMTKGKAKLIKEIKQLYEKKGTSKLSTEVVKTKKTRAG